MKVIFQLKLISIEYFSSWNIAIIIEDWSINIKLFPIEIRMNFNMTKVSTLFILLSASLFAQGQVSLIKLDQLQEQISTPKSNLTVINFWATWCGPCIKEIPYFEEINKLNEVDVLLVSLDFPQEKQKVEGFVTKKSLASQVYILDEKDYDLSIRSINEDWSGAIPATLMIGENGSKRFFEKAFTRDELMNEVNKYIN